MSLPEAAADIARRLRGLKRTRKSNRTLATQSINAAKALVGDEQATNREALLQGYLAVLESKLHKLETLDEQIKMLIPDDQSDEESASANEYVLKIDLTIAEIGSAIFNLKSKSNPPPQLHHTLNPIPKGRASQ